MWVIPNWGEWLIYWRAGLLLWTQSDWKKELLGNLMKFSKGKYEALHLGWYNPMCWDRLGTDCIESSFIKKKLGVMVDKLNVSQQCAPAANMSSCILG